MNAEGRNLPFAEGDADCDRGWRGEYNPGSYHSARGYTPPILGTMAP